ncbi:MAG: ABC transporter substrate-binding protein, partial [Rhodanobacteraceae bacterium]
MVLPLAMVLAACDRSAAPATVDPRTQTWEAVVAEARQQTVTMAMWQGDPAINAYMRDYVAPHLARD